MTWSRIRSIAVHATASVSRSPRLASHACLSQLDSCRGLAYLHNQVPPILHRDLKSANVLISETFVAKISDFGIARQLQIQTMTQRVGTTRWTAPEVSYRLLVIFFVLENAGLVGFGYRMHLQDAFCVLPVLVEKKIAF